MDRTQRESILRRTLTDPLLVGAIVILWIGIAVYLSSTAQNGLPYLSTYQVTAEVPDADHLITNADVRIGGDRVGQVKAIHAVALQNGQTYARVTLALSPSVKVPVDSTVEVQPASILGAKYLALTPGSSHRLVPDGGTLPLSRARVAVELSDVIDMFDQRTNTAIQSSLMSLGDALAGQGADLNNIFYFTSRLLPPLDQVLGVLSAQRSDLAGLIRGAAGTASALAPVAQTLVSALDNGEQTLRALNAAAGPLGNALDQMPSTESESTRALTDLEPVLADAATLARGLKAGAQTLPGTTGTLADTFQTATTVLGRVPPAAQALTKSVSKLDGDAASIHAALAELFPALRSLDTALETIEPAQVDCNVAGLFTRNVDSAFSQGDLAGSWFRIVLIGLPPDQYTQEPAPASNLHTDYYPAENSSECQAGNEPYAPGQKIGNPGPTSNQTQTTSPPPGVTQLAQHAGVLTRSGE
jgi:virulence factor Mce-like protein